MPYNNFTQMPVWQLALEIVKDVYKLTDKLPKREDYALCSQLRDAAISIAGIIAEGFGRGHKKDKINFYYYSRGSAFEVMSHLFCGIKAGYFSENEIQPICDKCNNCAESLNKIIKTLTNSKPESYTQPQSPSHERHHTRRRLRYTFVPHYQGNQ